MIGEDATARPCRASFPRSHGTVLSPLAAEQIFLYLCLGLVEYLTAEEGHPSFFVHIKSLLLLYTYTVLYFPIPNINFAGVQLLFSWTLSEKSSDAITKYIPRHQLRYLVV